MKSKILHDLDPDNLAIDDRNTEDLILYVKKLSKHVNYFNNTNNVEGDWSTFFSEETFLLAEISNFEINKYDLLRLKLIKNFDEFSTEDEMIKTLTDFFSLIYSFFNNVNVWYIKALKNNLSIKSSLIENELEQAIQNKLKNHFHLFYSYVLSFKEFNNLNISFEEFNIIWDYKSVQKKNIYDDVDLSQSRHASAFKKLILLYNPVYEVIFYLKSKSKIFFKKSYNENDNHNPQVGLLLSFLELFKYHQNEINNFTKRHLDYYFKDLLKQKPHPKKPDQVHVDIEIDENIDSLVIYEDEPLIAGQDENGDDIIYRTNHEIVLNNTKVSEISSLYVSRNKKFDFNSSFSLVSGIYSKIHAKSYDDIINFNTNNDSFSSLGEDQIFKSTRFKTMEVSDLGFAISSPTLISDISNKEIIFDLFFTVDSIQYLSNLILDISKNTNQSEEDVFFQIFSKAFKISYTSENGWSNVNNYLIHYPDDWTKGIISIKINLDKSYSSIIRFDREIHKKNISTNYPVFQFLLNTNNFYFPYSFLDGMEILRFNTSIKVANLKNISIFNDDGEINNNSEFEIFGPNPGLGSKLFVGNNEIFSKKIKKLSIGWDYTNLPIGFKNLKNYYKDYDYKIDDHSFKFNIEALVDFSFQKNLQTKLVYELFNTANEKIADNLLIEIDCEKLKLKPSNDLRSFDSEEFSYDLETGFLKLELIDPEIGFGFNHFPKMLQNYVDKIAQSKADKNPNLYDEPNEPFSPKISNLYINYLSESSLLFNEKVYSDSDKFFIIHPVDEFIDISSNPKGNTNIVPTLNFQGELFLGFDNMRPSQDLNLFFEIKKDENTNYKFSSKLDWYYSGHNGWKLLEKSNILYDETFNLMRTGVICFRLNSDMSNKFINPNNDRFYLKACSKNQVDQFSLINKIVSNAVLITHDLNSDNFNHTLSPNSIQDFLIPKEGVINLNQRLSSFGGLKKENDLDFYKRVSQLLSHKNRPSTKKDFENFIISNFNWLSYVKCYSFSEKNSNLKCLCIKKISKNQNIDEIKLSQADTTVIKKFIKNHISPFIELKIINPVFEDVWVKGKVKFINIASGKGIVKLNKDLLNFFCPWVESFNYDDMKIGGSFKRSDIINFIKSRPYIGYVTGISIIHVKSNIDGETEIYDSANDKNTKNYIKAGNPHSILIPKDYNQIDMLESEKYSPPEKTNFSELNVEENFVISNDTESPLQLNNEIKKMTDTNKITLNFKF